MSVLTGRGRDSYEGLRERLERSEREKASLRSELDARTRADEDAEAEAVEAQEQAEADALTRSLMRHWHERREVEARVLALLRDRAGA
jgi:hypothetical protein